MRRLAFILLGFTACNHAPRAPVQDGAPAAAPHARPAPRGAEHAVFSLIDNRLLAHVERDGGLVALPGWPGFAKYLRFGEPNRAKLPWTLHQRKDDRWVGVAAQYAWLGVPLTEEQAAARKVVVRLWNPTARKMTVMTNGKNAMTLQLAAGWQVVTATVPAGLLHAGENDLQLAFERGEAAQVEWIQVGGGAAATGEDELAVYDPARRALVMKDGLALVWYVQVPKEGRLVGDVGDGCVIAVEARAAGGAAATGTLSGEDAAVDLGALAGKVARLRIAPAGGCKSARLSSAALAVPGPAPAVTHTKRPGHIVLWIMDSLRADRLRAFTPRARPEAPTFAQLAASSTLFTSTYVQGNESRASHASIWTALYPVRHRMIDADSKLDTSWVTLAEAMKAAGFATSGVTANGYVSQHWGFGEGWDSFKNHIHDGGGFTAEDILKDGLDSVARNARSPFFLYLGTVDTHVSWRAKEPWLSRYDARPYEGRFKTEASGHDVELMAAGKLAVSERDKEHIIAIYDSNVSYQDAMLGKLLAALATWGIADDTMIVVVADHGDEQWEDGRVGHGGSLRESLVHVPLLIHYPPLFPAGAVDEGAETIDILPTLLDAVGMNPPEDAQGASLLPLAQGVGRGYPRPAISSQYENAHAMRLGDWKARVAASGVPSVYNLDEDPGERRDLAETRPLERRFLTDALSTFLIYQKEWKKGRWGVASNASPQLADDLER